MSPAFQSLRPLTNSDLRSMVVPERERTNLRSAGYAPEVEKCAIGAIPDGPTYAEVAAQSHIAPTPSVPPPMPQPKPVPAPKPAQMAFAL